MADTDYKNSIREINKLYVDRAKRAAARSFMLSCKESGIAYPVALDLLKSSAAVPASDQIATKSDLKADFKPVNTEHVENTTLSSETVENGQIETVNDAGGLNLQEIEQKVKTCLSDFMALSGIEDDNAMRKAPQSLWQSFCIYNGKHIFKGTKILKSDKLADYGSATRTNNNAYDIDKIVAVLGILDNLCNYYNKIMTSWSATAFLGVDHNFLADHNEKLTLSGFDYKQKNEETLVDMITSGQKNPTGAICVLNHVHGYGQTRQETTKTTNNVYIFPALGQIKPENVPTLPEMP